MDLTETVKTVLRGTVVHIAGRPVKLLGDVHVASTAEHLAHIAHYTPVYDVSPFDDPKRPG